MEKTKWKFSHNNDPEIIVEAATESEAIAVGLATKGIATTTHPVRAWPAQTEEDK